MWEKIRLETAAWYTWKIYDFIPSVNLISRNSAVAFSWLSRPVFRMVFSLKF